MVLQISYIKEKHASDIGVNTVWYDLNHALGLWL